MEGASRSNLVLFELEALARDAVQPHTTTREEDDVVRAAELQAYRDVHGRGERDGVRAARRAVREAEEEVRRLHARLARSRIRGKGPRARSLRGDAAYTRTIKSLTSQLLAARLVLKDKVAELEAAEGRDP